MKRTLFIFLLFFVTRAFAGGSITQVDSIAQVMHAETEEGTFYFIDVDDTLIKSPYSMGSLPWKRYFSDYPDARHRLELLFVSNFPMAAVEPQTMLWIQALQARGYPVFGLTARERDRWYDIPLNGVDQLTIDQLDVIGVNFSKSSIPPTYQYLQDNPEYFQNIFFADLEPKGNYLLKIFQNAPTLPLKVIFIDDKKQQVESVASALEQLGIPYECYWYTAADQRGFDPLISNIQLYFLLFTHTVLSDQEAADIALNSPEKGNDFYLKQILMQVGGDEKSPG